MLRKSERPVRWQRANMFFQFVDSLSDDDPVNTVFVVAQIPDHLGSDADANGRLLTNMVRRIEIGGMVFNWDMEFFLNSDNGSQSVSQCTQILTLVSDRLDEAGVPAAVSTDWGTNTTPIPVASATETVDEDIRFPNRVHWRQGYTSRVGNAQFTNATGDYRITDQVRRPHGGANLRLRTALDDGHVLAFHWYRKLLGWAPAEDQSVVCSLNVQGSLYYRVRF